MLFSCYQQWHLIALFIQKHFGVFNQCQDALMKVILLVLHKWWDKYWLCGWVFLASVTTLIASTLSSYIWYIFLFYSDDLYFHKVDLRVRILNQNLIKINLRFLSPMENKSKVQTNDQMKFIVKSPRQLNI